MNERDIEWLKQQKKNLESVREFLLNHKKDRSFSEDLLYKVIQKFDEKINNVKTIEDTTGDKRGSTIEKYMNSEGTDLTIEEMLEILIDMGSDLSLYSGTAILRNYGRLILDKLVPNMKEIIADYDD